MVRNVPVKQVLFFLFVKLSEIVLSSLCYPNKQKHFLFSGDQDFSHRWVACQMSVVLLSCQSALLKAKINNLCNIRCSCLLSGANVKGSLESPLTAIIQLVLDTHGESRGTSILKYVKIKGSGCCAV